MIGRGWIICVLGWALGCGLAVGQAASGTKDVAARAVAAERTAFEVVSIRQNVAGGATAFGATPDGFRMVNMSLGRVIMTAYVPTTGEALYWEMEGLPAWVNQDRYDIEAKVAEADLAEWQKPGSQQTMMEAMLQTMLADRFNLKVHREQKDAQVYYLEIGKGALKLKEAEASEAYPKGRNSPYPGGGAIASEGGQMHFYQAPMTLLASLLTNRNLGGPEIQDRTGLKGRYDFVVDWGAWTGGMGSADAGAADPGPTLFSAVAALGLKLTPAKGKVEALVVDHVERPTAN
jgi:uncharacterized protein (TIGR03435 family)